MNIKPRPATTFKQAVRKGLRNALLAFIPFAFIAFGVSLLPVTTTYASPESHDSAVVQSQEARTAAAYERAMEKCDTLPANTLPGAVVIDLEGQEPRFTRNAHLVDMGFSVALGEENSRVEGVTLCR